MSRMSKLRLAALTIAMFVATLVVTTYLRKGAALPQVSASGPSGPAIEYLSKRKFDAGFFREGEQVRHQFYFMNAGHETLSIERIDASCSCASATLDRSELDPGQAALLEVAVDTLGRTGDLAADVRLLDENSVVASFQLLLRVETGRGVTLEPTRVVLLPGTSSDSPSRQFELIVESLVDDPPPQLELTLDQEETSLVLSEPLVLETQPGRSRFMVRVEGEPQCIRRTAFATVKCSIAFGDSVVTDRAVIEVVGEYPLPQAVFLGGALAPGVTSEVPIVLPVNLASRLREDPATTSAPSVSVAWGDPSIGVTDADVEHISLFVRVTPVVSGPVRERVVLGGRTCPVSIDVVGATAP